MRSLCSGVVRAKTAICGTHRPQRLIRQGIEFGTGHRPGIVSKVQLPGEGQCCRDMVAGNHLHVDSGGAALRNGEQGFIPRWVDEADQSKKHHIRLEIGKCQPFGSARQPLGGETEHALAGGGSGCDVGVPLRGLTRPASWRAGLQAHL